MEYRIQYRAAGLLRWRVGRRARDPYDLHGRMKWYVQGKFMTRKAAERYIARHSWRDVK